MVFTAWKDKAEKETRNKQKLKGEKILDTRQETARGLKLIELFVDGLSKTPCENQHLLVTAFLTVKTEDNSSMSALVAPVKSKFRELIKIKYGKYKKELFYNTLSEISFSATSREVSSVDDEMSGLLAEISGYTSSSIFLVSDDELQDIATPHIMNVTNGYVLSIVEPFYSFVKLREQNFDFNKCIKECESYRERKEQRKQFKQAKKVKNQSFM